MCAWVHANVSSMPVVLVLEAVTSTVTFLPLLSILILLNLMALFILLFVMTAELLL